MHDTHCHVDLYEHPETMVQRIEREKIFTIAVTNLPSAYREALPHVKRFQYIHLAIGFHPLLAAHHTQQQRKLFENLLSDTSFVGEIGLDFSREGIGTKEKQLESFRYVLQCLKYKKKVVTLHSRRAERNVLELLKEYEITPVIFHWYSGSISLIPQIVTSGHYFSINPVMTNSTTGQSIIRAIPKERVLTETDAPFTKIEGKPTFPSDVRRVHHYLAELREMTANAAENLVEQNLRRLLDVANVPVI